MVSFEKVGVVLLGLMAIVIVALLGPAAIGAVLGAGLAIGAMRLNNARH